MISVQKGCLYLPPLPQFFERAGMFRARYSAWEADCGVHDATFYIACPANERRLFPVRDYGSRDFSQIANYGSLRSRSMPRAHSWSDLCYVHFLSLMIPSVTCPASQLQVLLLACVFFALQACFPCVETLIWPHINILVDPLITSNKLECASCSDSSNCSTCLRDRRLLMILWLLRLALKAQSSTTASYLESSNADVDTITKIVFAIRRSACSRLVAVFHGQGLKHKKLRFSLLHLNLFSIICLFRSFIAFTSFFFFHKTPECCHSV